MNFYLKYKKGSVCLFFSGLFLLFFSSCFKEKPIKITTNLSGEVATAAMGEHYNTQLYYNIQTRSFVSSNSRFDYDLAFDAEDGKYMIWMNGAKLMQSNMPNKKFADVSFDDTLSTAWRVEYGMGRVDSNSFGKWYNETDLTSIGKTYILKLGLDENDNPLGYKKLMMQDYNSGYNITYANLDNTDMHTSFIPKRTDRNFIFYSFSDHQVKDLEPSQSNWDLQFTVYSVYFYKEKLPYKVNGVLTNPYATHTQAYLFDSVTDFNTIKKADVNDARFNSDRDNIGYEWKRYEFGHYVINTKYNFIIKSDDRYFKFRFLDFYDSNGIKGYPKFEFSELQ